MDMKWTSLAHACHASWTRDDRRDRIALVSADASFTYGQLAEHAGKVAAALHGAGVARGAIVAIAMERTLDAVLALFGVLMAGGCPCPLEPRLSIEETHTRFTAVGVDWLLYDASQADYASDLRFGPSLAYEALDTDGAFLDLALTAADRALLLFTSGSTGRPKGVLLSHGNLLANVAGVIPHSGLSEDDVLLHVMPLYHTNGLNNQLFAPLLAGARVALATRFKADDMPALLEAFRPTIITGVPTMYSRMLAQPFSAASHAQLRMARCGSAPLTPDLQAQVEAKLGCPMVVSYGLSEATCTSTMNPPTGRKVGSVGTVLAGQQVCLFAPNSTTPVAPGTDGEICIGGPNLMLGYLGADPGQADATRDGWLHTGDLGRFDNDGFLFITGRIKDVIIRGGENLSPILIENTISADPQVLSCIVVGKADADLGEVPVAFVIPAAGAVIDAGYVQQIVASRLPRIYRPQEVYFVDRLPETAVGKIDRKALVARVRAMASGSLASVG
jgi:malonyl-CoA/methylmalonyl-CoA synthetase